MAEIVFIEPPVQKSVQSLLYCCKEGANLDSLSLCLAYRAYTGIGKLWTKSNQVNFSMTRSDLFMFVDESGSNPESKILVLACIITTNPDGLRRELNKLKEDTLRDPSFKNLPSVNTSLATKGFHYCEDHQEIKPKIIDLIMRLSFEAYIIYKEKDTDFAPSAGYGWYDQLFGRLMFERLRANAEAVIRLYFEQHDNRISRRRDEIREIIERLIDKIRARDGEEKFPIIPEVISADKNEPCLAVADYVAAIFRDYEGNRQPESWQARNFQRIRPKIRVIHNFSTDEFFTRQNLFY